VSAYNQACARVCAIRIGRYTTFENVAGQEKFYNLLSTKYITIVARLHTVLMYMYCPPHETLMDTFYTVAVASDSPLKAGYVSCKPRSVWLSRRGLDSVSPTNSFEGIKIAYFSNEIRVSENIFCILYTLSCR
jgi:hypothetical protein